MLRSKDKSDEDLSASESVDLAQQEARQSRQIAEIIFIMTEVDERIDFKRVQPKLMKLGSTSSEPLELVKKIFEGLYKAKILTVGVIKNFLVDPVLYTRIFSLLQTVPMHPPLMYSLLSKNFGRGELEAFAESFNIGEFDDEDIYVFVYESRPWLTQESFALMLQNAAHCTHVIPAFLKQCINRKFATESKYHNGMPDILDTLFCMQAAGVRLDNHNSKVAFAFPRLGRAYHVCNQNDCLKEDDNFLRMSRLDVIRHLSQYPELVSALIELGRIYEMALRLRAVAPITPINVYVNKLFDCTFPDEEMSFCMLLFKRRQEPRTIANVMSEIRNDYHIHEYKVTPR